ncbi:hypothetical protein Lal_00037897 [Lupinus albus]|uniref:Uncharacterized protein n=1 Tax=Lupinus albus TaxID=3870 RepID=A0A6A4QWU0_LUPAL|nr:hypothetical protein Lalb_Chr03g0040811 [Lupinus albus]KAF1895781.1 hypothetical protein Lal_00037897 [Lupinus albus]
MRCKKHITDLSSTVGVCATCLHQRLTALLQAQAQAQAQAQLMRVVSRSSDEISRNSSNPPPPLVFPRSVSPYVSSRKSEYDAACDGCDRRERLFFSTPQIGATFYGGGEAVNGDEKRWKKRFSKFGIFSKLFRSRSEKFRSDPSSEQSSLPSPSWFSTVLSNRRKNCDRLGISPARADECFQTTSASGCSSESSPMWWRTPAAAVGRNSTRRSRLGLENSVSDSGMGFCLSPMVRLKHNVLAPEKAAAKPHLSAAASFCANRSRKLADFGKVNHNR